MTTVMMLYTTWVEDGAEGVREAAARYADRHHRPPQVMFLPVGVTPPREILDAARRLGLEIGHREGLRPREIQVGGPV